MAKLHATERLIINQLFDHGVFTSSITAELTNTTTRAVQALKKPITQQRINKYLKDLIGIIPKNYQENLLLLISDDVLPAQTVHVLLATLKTIINLPELQGKESNHVVSTELVIKQVHSEVIELDEHEILKEITDLFVNRFALFTVDVPESNSTEDSDKINEYWDISPDFNFFAECIVDYLLSREKNPILNDIQRVNQALLTDNYIGAKQSPELWATLVSNKDYISHQWSQLKRFYLECGDDYALLLDQSRRTISSKSFIAALLVAKSLINGLPEDQLKYRINEITKNNFPDVRISNVKIQKLLFEEKLIIKKNGFLIASPIIDRFQVKTSA